MRSVVLVLLALIATSCQTTPSATAGHSAVQYSGGDGTTAQSAVVISATDHSAGVDAEYAWIQKYLPGAKLESQSLVQGPKMYDMFEVTLPSGEKRKVFFDISSFFGKGW
jgi:hypothetical protein